MLSEACASYCRASCLIHRCPLVGECRGRWAAEVTSSSGLQQQAEGGVGHSQVVIPLVALLELAHELMLPGVGDPHGLQHLIGAQLHLPAQVGSLLIVSHHVHPPHGPAREHSATGPQGHAPQHWGGQCCSCCWQLMPQAQLEVYLRHAQQTESMPALTQAWRRTRGL